MAMGGYLIAASGALITTSVVSNVTQSNAMLDLTEGVSTKMNTGYVSVKDKLKT